MSPAEVCGRGGSVEGGAPADATSITSTIVTLACCRQSKTLDERLKAGCHFRLSPPSRRIEMKSPLLLPPPHLHPPPPTPPASWRAGR